MRPFGSPAIREERGYGALRRNNWWHIGWRRDHCSGLGKLESDVQLRVTSRERFQSKTCLSALLPEICHMGKLVLGKSLGGGGPRSLWEHGRSPAPRRGGRPSALGGALRGNLRLSGVVSPQGHSAITLKKCILKANQIKSSDPHIPQCVYPHN